MSEIERDLNRLTVGEIARDLNRLTVSAIERDLIRLTVIEKIDRIEKDIQETDSP